MSEQVVRTFEERGRKYREVDDGTIYCDRKGCPGSTGLRGHRTGVPICMKCAVRTPVGYISQDAAKEQADKYFNIRSLDYVIAATTAFFATFIIGFIVSGFGFFALLFAFPIGGVIGELVLRTIRNKRGRYTQRVVGSAMALASFFLFIFTGNIFAGLFGIIATGAAVSRFEVAIRT